MPFFRIDSGLVYYAHVPKCGGSSVRNYLRERFGPLGFQDLGHMTRPEAQRWTRSSPQHVDVQTLERLIPPDFFAARFAVVRHPVGRAVSTYHFQLEVERTIPTGTGFSDWLARIEAERARDPFAYDNHTRPMTEIVPAGSRIFHIEHGLDPLVDWLDSLAGEASGPRAIPPENTRGAHVKVASAPVTPSGEDLRQIERLYAGDFRRFGYRIGEKMPGTPPPEPPAALRRLRKAVGGQGTRLRRRIARRLGLWRGDQA